MNIAIFGAGSVGCYLGGCLVAKGANVQFIGRPRIKQAIERRGLTLTDWQGRKDQVFIDDITFSTSPESLANADVILVTVKGTATTDAAEAIQHFAKESATIVSFQNGIRNSQILKQLLPQRTVLAGMVPFNIVNNDDCHFHCGTEGHLSLEVCNGHEQAIASALNKAGFPVDTYDGMREVQWGKLLLNLNNSVNALAGIPLLEELHDTNFRYVLAQSVDEALRTLEAEGITPRRMGKVIPTLIPRVLTLPTWLFTRVAKTMLKIDPAARSSMQEDLKRGRVTEIDFLNVEIQTLAKKHHIPTPFNDKIITLIKSAEKAGQGSPQIKGIDLRKMIEE